MEWLNEPPQWSESDGVLEVVTGSETDFWRETHYAFIHDNGHFRYQVVEGDFTATVRFAGQYAALYDQAGLMVRLDDRNWIKAGIEFTDGAPFLSVVVTRDYSDWSVTPFVGNLDDVDLRLSRHGDAIRVEQGLNGRYQMLRLAYLSPGRPAQVGPMACSPTRAGFTAVFRDFQVGPPISSTLHE